jgi:hypothetical protein
MGGHPPGGATRTTTSILFGGESDAAGNGDALGDTWTLDGSDWTVQTGSGPAARFDASLASVGSHAVLFGGVSQAFASDFGDTWIWNGTSWTELPGTSSPSPRDSCGMGAL